MFLIQSLGLACAFVSRYLAEPDNRSAVSDVTQILTAIEQGDANAADKLLPLVYEELRKLAEDNLQAELVKLRYFVGMTLDEAAEVLGISTRTADNYWVHARAWLFSELKDQGR